MRLLTIILTLTLLSCSGDKPERLSSMEFIQWIESSENQFIRHKDFEGIQFSVFYKPAEYLALKEQEDADSFDLKYYKSRIEGLKKQYNFGFRLRSDEGNNALQSSNTNETEYFQKLRYYLTNAQQDFQLIIPQSNDTIECSTYHMERNYGAAPFIDINLAFINPTTELQDFIIKFEDHVFLNGTIKFAYEKDNIQNLPEIQF